MTEDPELGRLGLKLGRPTTETGLDAVPRALGRRHLQRLPAMIGHDLWNAYEVSFLTSSGKPAVYHLRLQYEATTANIVESKSLKLYLNAANDQVYSSRDHFAEKVAADLAATVGGPVRLTFFEANQSPTPQPLPGRCLDGFDLPAEPSDNTSSDILTARDGAGAFGWHSHLLRSNCPVTNQPDWGSVFFGGIGVRHPEPASLLAYLLHFRHRRDFHETCCETLFNELYSLLLPRRLVVACYYTRRGGLDINPIRATHADALLPYHPVWRQ